MADRDQDEWITGAFIGMGLAGLGLGGGLAAASATMGPPAIAVWGIAFVTVAAVVKSPVASAFAKRLGERGSQEAEVPDELYVELDDLRTRMLEMEERQEFSERMLAQKQHAAVPEGGSSDGGS